MRTADTRPYRRLLGARLVGMVIVSLLASVVMTTAPAHVAAATNQTPIITTSTFELQPDAGLVHATVVYRITNRIPCSATACYYIDSGQIGVDPAGTNFRASTAGGISTVRVKAGKEGYLSTATFTYPATFKGKTRTVTLTYDVLGGKPRSGADTRVGQAYSRFCGYPGLGFIGDQGSFSLVVPKRYDVDQIIGDTLKETTSDGKVVLASGAYTATVGDEDAHGACVEAVDASQLSETNHQAAGDLNVKVQAWPEDATWLASVSDAVTNVLGQLEDKIGIAPHTKAITVREVVAETVGGYAASYSSAESLTRVSEEALDSLVVTHELAHAWFDETFSTENWLTEGYAEYFARSLASTAGLGSCQPAADTSVILARWYFLPALPTDADQQRVAAYYDDACAIITMVGAKVTDAKMAEIVGAAFNGEIPYAGAGDAEKTRTGPLTWRDWLDLVDERALIQTNDSDPDWLQKLLIEYGVASPSDVIGRSAARAHYHALQARLGTWDVPMAIRSQMAQWQFADAEKSISTASSILDTRDGAVASVPALKDSTVVSAAFAAAKDQAALDAVLALATDEARAAKSVAAARAAASADRGPVGAVGLIGQNLDRDAQAAIATLVKGEDSKAVKQAAAVSKTAADATGAGMVRLGGASVVVLFAVGGVFVVRRRRRGLPVAVSGVAVTGDTSAPPVEADPMPVEIPESEVDVPGGEE